MGLFSFSKKPQRRFTRESFEQNLAGQLKMTPETLAQLRQLDVAAEKQLKLEFFFYTDASAKAAALAGALSKLQYEAEHGTSASDANVHVVTGWSSALPMSDATVLAWTKRMCELGFEHDCEFDGWGTNPGQ